MTLLRKMIAVALALLVPTLLAACGEREANAELDAEKVNAEQNDDSMAGYRSTVLYYSSDDGFVVPVMKSIPWEEGIGHAALECLVNTDDNSAYAGKLGLSALIPDGTEMTLRISDEGVATVDLINLGECKSEKAERAMVEAIVNTLTEFNSINSVTITVNGKAVDELPLGTKLKSKMERFALNAETDSVSASADGATATTLYFPNSSASLNVPVTRYLSGEVTFETAARELVSGPAESALINCFPEGTSVLGASIYEGVATVDLSEEFLAVSEVEGLAEAAYESLYLTADALENIYALYITVEGEDCALTAGLQAPEYANEFPG